MKSFLVIVSDRNPDLLTKDLRAIYVDYIKTLKDSGKLPICGPFPNFEGAMLVIRAESQAEVEEFIQRAPFIQNGYFKKYVIHEFLEASDDNNWLARWFDLTM